MRTPIEALKEIRDRLTYFCLRTDGKYDPPWATELVGIIDDAVTDSHAVGNAAEMREALVNIAEYAKYAQCHTEDAHVLGYLRQMENWAQAALALPLRNCDVGTPEEQVQRMTDAFCMKQWKDGLIRCSLCPISCTNGRRTCTLTWAQMPYAAERKGEGDD